jgi:hypothetical protein
MKLNRESASLAPRRIGFDSRHLHLFLRLRSVSGKHAPVVRPRCGFESCRRLLPTPVAQWTERCPATAAAAGSTPAGRTRSSSRGRSSDGRAPGFHPGEARSTRVVRSLKARGVTQQAWRALTSSVRVRILAGLFFLSFVAGRSGSVIYGQNGLGRAVRSRASDRISRPRLTCMAAAGRSIDGYRQERPTRASGGRRVQVAPGAHAP